MTKRNATAIRALDIRRARFPLDVPFSSAIVHVDAVHLVIMELATEDGPTGLSYAFAFSSRDAEMIEACLRAVTDLVIGQDAVEVEALWQRISSAVVFLGLGGPMLAALSVIDMACWDIRAKERDLPLHRLLGNSRGKIPAYASGGSLGLDPGQLADEVGGYAQAGFRQTKVKLASEIEVNFDRLSAVRQAVGEEMIIYADGNQQWSPRAAIEANRALEEFSTEWLEEPVDARDYDGLAQVRQNSGPKIATGETNFGEHEFAQLLRCRSADVLMPNLQRVGGITGWLRIANAARAEEVAMASHVNAHFSLPLMCATSNAVTLEYIPWWPNPFNEEIRFSDGCAIAFEGAGFGVTLDEARLRHNPAA